MCHHYLSVTSCCYFCPSIVTAMLVLLSFVLYILPSANDEASATVTSPTLSPTLSSSGYQSAISYVWSSTLFVLFGSSVTLIACKCCSSTSWFYRLFPGSIIYIAVALIGSNLVMLRLQSFPGYSTPLWIGELVGIVVGVEVPGWERRPWRNRQEESPWGNECLHYMYPFPKVHSRYMSCVLLFVVTDYVLSVNASSFHEYVLPQAFCLLFVCHLYIAAFLFVLRVCLHSLDPEYESLLGGTINIFEVGQVPIEYVSYVSPSTRVSADSAHVRILPLAEASYLAAAPVYVGYETNIRLEDGFS